MRTYLLLLLALTTSAFLSAQSVVHNGGFESPGLPAGKDILYLTNGSTYVTGWSVIDDGVGQPPFYGNTDLNDAVFSGEYGLVLNQQSGIKTVFRTEVGEFYELGLWLRPDDCRGCVTPAPLRATIAGNSATRPVITSLSLDVIAGWTYQTVQFYATHTINTLELYNPASTSDYKRYTIDEVTIRKVPAAVLGVQLKPVVTVEGTIGAKYQIQGANDLSAPLWTTLTNLVLSNSPTLFLDSTATGPHRVYRAVRVPQ